MRKSAFSLLSLALIVISLAVVLHFKRTGASATLQEAQILNETESIQVVSRQITDQNLVLKLKNASNKPIIAYTIEYQPGAESSPAFDMDLTSSAHLFGPQTEITTIIPLAALARDEQTATYKVKIAMAMFADGEAEGDWKRAQSRREQIKGADLALQNIKKRLPASGNQQSLNRFIMELQELAPSRGLSEDYRKAYLTTVQAALIQTHIALREPVKAMGNQEIDNFAKLGEGIALRQARTQSAIEGRITQ
jgi:hypothetical protein